ncbi:MAG: MBG domain-containing protein [Bacillota bacterium]
MTKRLKVYATLVLLMCVILAQVIFNVSGFVSADTTYEATIEVEEVVYINNEDEFSTAFCGEESITIPSTTTYILMQDLYLDNYPAMQVSSLAGVFDGNGHTIVGLNIGTTSMFGSIEGAFKDTTLIDATITVGEKGAFIAQSNKGEISNINIVATADIIKSADFGGLCYLNEGSISDCYIAIDLQNAQDNVLVGGLVWWNYDNGSIANSYYDISFDGEYDSTVSYFANEYTGSGDSDVTPPVYTEGKGYIIAESNVYSINTLVDAIYYSNIVDEQKSATLASNINIFNCLLSSDLETLIKDLISNSSYYTAYNSDLITIKTSSTNANVTASESLQGTGTSDDPYLITSIADLTLMATDDTYCQADVYVKQVADLSFVGYEISIIASFGGYYDGNGYSISGLYKYLFEKVADTATITDLYLIGSVTSDLSAFVYMNEGTIQNITAIINFKETNSSGLVAHNDGGKITNCSVSATGVDGCYAICGYNSGTVNVVRNISTYNMFNENSGTSELLYTTASSWSDDESVPTNSIMYYDDVYYSTGDSFTTTFASSDYWVYYSTDEGNVYTLKFLSDREIYNTKTSSDSSTTVGTRKIYIYSEDDFAKYFCNSSSTTIDTTAHYILMADLYLDNYAQWKVSALNGIFDGNGHTIVGLNIGSSSLFGTIATNAQFIDTTLIDVTITASTSNFGIVANTNNGTISNVNIVYSADISAVTGTFSGLCYTNYGTISNCYVNADVTGATYINAGGLVGINGYKQIIDNIYYTINGTITDSYYHINTANGLLDLNYYAIATNDDGKDIIGNFSTENPYFAADSDTYSINTLVDVLYYSNIANVEKSATLASDINIFNCELQDEIETIVVALLEDSNYTAYNSDLTTIKSSEDKATIYASGSLQGSGTILDPYLIVSIEDLALVANSDDYSSVYLKQVADLSFIGYAVPTISSFSGYYDGGGYSISGLYTYLFDIVGYNGTITDLYVIGSVTATSGLINTNYGTVQNITAYLTIADNCAGLVYSNNGTITRSTVTATGSGFAVAQTLQSGSTVSEVRNFSELCMFDEVATTASISLLYTTASKWSDDESVPTNSIMYNDSAYTATSNTLAYTVTNISQWSSYADTAADVYTLQFASDRMAYKEKINSVSAKNYSTTYSVSDDTTATDVFGLQMFTITTEYSDYTKTITWYSDSSYTTVIAEGTALKNAGTYYVLLTFASTTNTMLFEVRGTYTVNKAVLTYLDSDFTYIDGIGGSITYDGEEFKLSQVVPLDLPSDVSFTYIITSYSGSGTKGDNPKDAGIYTIEATISADTYANYTITLPILKITIEKLSLTIAINMAESIAYNSAITTSQYSYYLPENSGIIEGEDIGVVNFASATFTTSYKQGTSAVGSGYYIRLDTNSVTAANYTISTTYSYFSVVKADIAETFSWTDSSFTYDGNYHAIAIAGDTSAYTITYKTSTGTAVSSNGYIDVGSYSYVATINYKNNSNYNELTVSGGTMVIDKAKLTVTADDLEVQYKDSIPTYTATYTLFERADGAVDSIGTLKFTCDYSSSSEPNEYTITVSGGSSVSYEISYVSGTLTVGKADRDLSLELDSMLFTGDVFSPTINCATAGKTVGEGDLGTITYYDAEGDVLDGAPSACGDYSLSFTTTDSNFYNSATWSFEFSITIGNLDENYVAVDGDYYEGSYKKEYDTEGVTIGLKNALPDTTTFAITYKYTYAGNNYELDYAPAFTNAGSYTSISIVITSDSYATKTISYTGVYITTATLSVEDLAATYTYSATEIAITPTLATDPFDGDTVNVSYTISGDSSILAVGNYTLKLALDNSNYTLSQSEFTVTVVAATVDIDFSEMLFVYEYGECYSKFNGDITYVLGGSSYDAEVGFVVDNYSYLATLSVGTYSITSLNSIYINNVESVKFNISGGTNIISVTPKEITFDWSNGEYTLLDTYVYSASEINAEFEVAESYFNSQKVFTSEKLYFTLICDSTIKDVGDYVVYASINNSNYMLAENSKQKSVTVTKASLTVTVVSTSVVYGEEVSGFTCLTKGMYSTDSISTVYECDYEVGDIVGTFTITASAEHANYDITIVNGTLSVVNADITGIEVSGGTYTYSGTGCVVTVTGATDIHTVTIDSYPINVGEYTVTVTVSAANYNTATITADIVINKAQPTIEIAEYKALYRDNTTIDIADIAGVVLDVNGATLAGSFSMEDSILVMGSNEYEVVFTPTDANYAEVAVLWTVTGYVEEEDIQLSIGNGNYYVDDSGDVAVDKDYVTISIYSITGIHSSSCQLYINGELVESGTYTLNESEELLVEIVVDGASIYSESVNFKLNTIIGSVDDEDVDVDDDFNDDSEEGNSTELNTEPNWVVIGIIIGVVAAIAIAGIVVIIVKKKRAI